MKWVKWWDVAGLRSIFQANIICYGHKSHDFARYVKRNWSASLATHVVGNTCPLMYPCFDFALYPLLYYCFGLISPSVMLFLKPSFKKWHAKSFVRIPCLLQKITSLFSFLFQEHPEKNWWRADRITTRWSYTIFPWWRN